jgi:hypothetical protein
MLFFFIPLREASNIICFSRVVPFILPAPQQNLWVKMSVLGRKEHSSGAAARLCFHQQPKIAGRYSTLAAAFPVFNKALLLLSEISLVAKFKFPRLFADTG